MTATLSPDQLRELQRHDTCTVSNAIESFAVRMRNEGFADASIRCLTPRPQPLVGYAVTVRIRTTDLPKSGHRKLDRTDWWECFQSLPMPRIVVVEDMDEKPGTGSFMGEVHANILRALGCVGVITNGAVRDLPGLLKSDLHVFARSLAVSHCYSHIVESGGAVEIGGLTIQPGDLLHADMHGVLSVPIDIASQVPAVADAMVEREQRVIDLCRAEHFSLESLRDAVKGIFH